MNIVVVESPAKAKTINKYLGPGYEVLASFGHVRDLPAKDGSVDPDARFPHDLGGRRQVAEAPVNDIARAVKGADKLILATDPDREGEAISWHVLEVLKREARAQGQAGRARRLQRHHQAGRAGGDEAPARRSTSALVDAYLARRALDYLVGFTLSPVLWRKLPGARSAGRVQSVALRLVCDRELEIETFVAAGILVAGRDARDAARRRPFEARLVGADGKKIQRLDIGTGDEAEAFKRGARNARASPSPRSRRSPPSAIPPPPFTTSTLQQEASRKLGFAPAHTMRIAQRLYEGVDIGGETVGLITYMRTDGVRHGAGGDHRGPPRDRQRLRRRATCPTRRAATQTKAKNAQEAHEAIRPTDLARRPREVARYLDPDQARLYELIWKRTVASQMESAELERTTVDIAAKVGGAQARPARHRPVVKFDGFLDALPGRPGRRRRRRGRRAACRR